MSSTQHEQALKYFKEHADDWHRKATEEDTSEVNVIAQRNNYVLDVVKERESTKTALDIGCGTGDLACDIAALAIDTTGIDFAEEMVQASEDKAKARELQNINFRCCSVLDYEFGQDKYDAISANGFIEYISLEEMQRMFRLIGESLTAKGSFVFGSRNQLYNIYSANAFTEYEVKAGNIESLLNEAAAFSAGHSIDELLKVACANTQDKETEHENTGIDVASRFQYTPVQLAKMLNEVGLGTIEVYPIHIHAVPPSFKKKNPEIHTSISNLLQSYARHASSLVPHSSSFMIHAIKG